MVTDWPSWAPICAMVVMGEDIGQDQERLNAEYAEIAEKTYCLLNLMALPALILHFLLGVLCVLGVK